MASLEGLTSIVILKSAIVSSIEGALTIVETGVPLIGRIAASREQALPIAMAGLLKEAGIVVHLLDLWNRSLQLVAVHLEGVPTSTQLFICTWYDISQCFITSKLSL